MSASPKVLKARSSLDHFPGAPELLRITPAGLYCPHGDFYIDPHRKVKRAVITHGHSDHARAGHGAVLATPPTLDAMAARYGKNFTKQQQALALGQSISLNGVTVTFKSAGHILGSAQVVIEADGFRVVCPGDYKRSADPTCPPFEPVFCDLFVTEATFGNPIFHHNDAWAETERLMTSVRLFPQRPHLITAYSLGKAQRVMALLRGAGFDGPVFVAESVAKLNKVYEGHGVDLGDWILLPEDAPLPDHSIVFGPGNILENRAGLSPVICFPSGWNRVKKRAMGIGGADSLPLILSDHADWTELTQTIHDVSPSHLWVAYGDADALASATGLPTRRVSFR